MKGGALLGKGGGDTETPAAIIVSRHHGAQWRLQLHPPKVSSGWQPSPPHTRAHIHAHWHLFWCRRALKQAAGQEVGGTTGTPLSPSVCVWKWQQWLCHFELQVGAVLGNPTCTQAYRPHRCPQVAKRGMKKKQTSDKKRNWLFFFPLGHTSWLLSLTC